MRTAALVAVAALAGAAAVAGAGYVLQAGRTTASQDPGLTQAAPRETADVTRQTLLSEEELDATLGYAGEGMLVGGLPGTWTWLPDEGDILEQGDRLAEVDGNDRTMLLYGAKPAWRTLRKGTTGVDVLQLERALDALGHLDRDVRPDRAFGESTRQAVRRWQKDAGVRVDGVVDLGEVVFATGPVRIATLSAQLGQPTGPGGTIAAITSATRIVRLDLDADRQDILGVGDVVEVELPDGSVTPGTVSEVGSVATADGGGDPQVPVTITLTDPAATGTLDGAPVTVVVTRERREDVLTVPVDALLALREGGYAVEIADSDGQSHLVGVDLGLFADGRVQVSGGVAVGDAVVVPR